MKIKKTYVAAAEDVVVYPLAGRVVRLLAGLVDGLLFFVALIFFGRLLDHRGLYEIIILSTYLITIFFIIPHSTFSQTLGELIFRIKIVNHDEKRLTLDICVARDLIFMPLALMRVMDLFNPKATLFHDKMLGIKAVRYARAKIKKQEN